MKKRMTAVFLCSFLLLTGCTKSNIVAPGNDSEPNMVITEGLEVNWEDAAKFVNEEYTGEGEYEFAKEITVEADENGNIAITVLVDEETDKTAAAEYAELMIKAVNDEAATQDFSYAVSEEASFGGYFAVHDVSIRIIPEGKEDDQSAWLVDASVEAGEYKKIEAK